MSYGKSSNPVEYVFYLLSQEFKLGMSSKAFFKAWDMNVSAHKRFESKSDRGYVHPQCYCSNSAKYNYPEHGRADSHE